MGQWWLPSERPLFETTSTHILHLSLYEQNWDIFNETPGHFPAVNRTFLTTRLISQNIVFS